MRLFYDAFNCVVRAVPRTGGTAYAVFSNDRNLTDFLLSGSRMNGGYGADIFTLAAANALILRYLHLVLHLVLNRHIKRAGKDTCATTYTVKFINFICHKSCLPSTAGRRRHEPDLIAVFKRKVFLGCTGVIYKHL